MLLSSAPVRAPGVRPPLSDRFHAALWPGSAGISAGALVATGSARCEKGSCRQRCRRSQVSHVRDASLNR